MKRALNEQKRRILELMSKMGNSFLLTELNEKYLDKLLDKISKEGINSLSPQEKEALNKLSRGEDVKDEPETVSLGLKNSTLRFTAARDSTVIPKDHKKLYGGTKNRLLAFIAGEAEKIAQNDTPIFVDGDLSNLDKPKEEQDIRMIVPKGEYECVAVLGDIDTDSFGNEFDEPVTCYYLILRDEGTHKDDIDEGNAFVFAAKKAKDAGENKFEFGGKKYKVEECVKNSTMKRTLNEEKKRIQEIMIPGHEMDKVDITKGGTWYNLNLNGENLIIIFKDKNIDTMSVLQPAQMSKEDVIAIKKDMKKFFDMERNNK